MTTEKYLRRTAWALGCLSLCPVGVGVAHYVGNECVWGFPSGQILGALIILVTVAGASGAYGLVWEALVQPTFTRALLMAAGAPPVLAALLWMVGRRLEWAQFAGAGLLWSLLLALPAVLGTASFHGLDGRRWLRSGVWIVGAVMLPLIRTSQQESPVLTAVTAIHFGMAVSLGAVLYWSIPGQPLRLKHLLVEGLVAVSLYGLTSRVL